MKHEDGEGDLDALQEQASSNHRVFRAGPDDSDLNLDDIDPAPALSTTIVYSWQSLG